MKVKTSNASKGDIAISSLYNVIDPEIGLNIVDLGLVYQIDFNEEDKEIFVTMTLTTQFCPMGDAIVSSTKQAMQQSFPEDKIQVNLTFDPPWDTSMISEEGNKFLNY
ncbi:MAG TPA: metal-sulfur cluster assembly factor [Cyclobacteriaceae bacterium]|jgi:metal-sulfur cluster biosynthetic enzyme|nr:metal-sulfur cluster assembly factor [Cyclobacteriaceae bacterium]HRK55644.1 metal-sulfur cluster assembly factor [Cyclobacteriaceae bacterium]